MNPEQKSFETIIHYHLEPELYSLRLLKQFVQTLSALTLLIKPGDEGYPVHLELETGMNRLGFGSDDLNELLQILSETKSLRVQSIFTHLAASEDASLDEYSQNQIHRFTMM